MTHDMTKCPNCENCIRNLRIENNGLKEAVDNLLSEIARLDNELADANELPTIAAMWGHHNRDDEVRELQAMCDELAEAGRNALPSLHQYRCPGAAGQITKAIAKYRAMIEKMNKGEDNE
jgi:hypothetical protein